MIEPSELRRIFDYSPETGVLTRKVKTGRNCALGVVGTLSPQGYLNVKIAWKAERVHRVAWAWMTGEWPDHQIDHVNLDKTDNRWVNLRKATPQQNSANRVRFTNNTSGKKGVSFEPKRNKFAAQIRVSSKLIHLGRFGSLEEAAAAYDQAAQRYFGEFARS